MIALVPSWAHHYDEFWDTLKRRNFWFIKLRYGAVLMLIAFLLSAEFILQIKFSETQVRALFIITFIILIYNIVLQSVRQKINCVPKKFNPLHFSLLQMMLDFIALCLLVYYTGSIETPLYMLFVFHMIIGSLILPGKVIYSMAVLIILWFGATVFGEYFNIIPHYTVEGFLEYPIYNNLHLIIAFSVVFAFVMFISVLLANSIARQLYKMEQDLVESLDKLNEAEAEKQKYIMGIVHEIKTPLVAMHSYLDLILQKYLGPINEKVEQKLIRAQNRSEEAINLTNNILRVSKLRLLNEFTVEDVNVHEIVNNICKKQTINIQTKKIHFSIKDKRENKKIVKGDKLLLEIALSNLISNAIKYVKDEGKVEIKIESENEHLIIVIADNGIGIPQKDLNNIFKEFFRASNILDKSYEGTGLGLSVVKQIVERHKGTITVESPSYLKDENNPGTSFKIKIPYDMEKNEHINKSKLNLAG